MFPMIKNNCTEHQKYFVKIIEGILKKIPDDQLEGIGEIVLFDNINSDACIVYLEGQRAEIQIDMSCYANRKWSFYSTLSLNIDLLGVISDHNRVGKGVRYLQKEREKGKINRKWMYFGVWSPLAYLFYFLLYPLEKTTKLKEYILKRAMEKIDK